MSLTITRSPLGHLRRGITSAGSRRPRASVNPTKRLTKSTSNSSPSFAAGVLQRASFRPDLYTPKRCEFVSRQLTTEAAPTTPQEPTDLPEKQPIPFMPLAISAISLIPFVACSVIPFAFPFEIAGKALFMQMTYGAVSLSMLGTVHWGLALADYKRSDNVTESLEIVRPSPSDQMLRYIGGVLPGLASWMFMTQEPVTGMVGLMGAFTALALFEVGAHKARLLPAWYVRLRMPWTITAVLCLGINLIHIL